MVQKGSQLLLSNDWERFIVGVSILESVGFVLKFRFEGWLGLGVRI